MSLAEAPLAPAPDLAAVKQRQQATWSTGDYSAVGVTLQIVGEELAEALDLVPGESVLDVAAGNGNATLAAARRFCHVTSTDYVSTLLERCSGRVAAEGTQASFMIADAEALPFEDGSFDAVVSNSLAHHLPDPGVLWSEIKRLLRPGGSLYVTDLLRAESKEKAREVVETYSGEEHPLLKDDFYHSLLAAFTLEEVRAQLSELGLDGFQVEAVSDRHWLVAGSLQPGVQS